MQFFFSIIQDFLLEVVNSKNVFQFQFILNELKVNPNRKISSFDGLSTFEKVLLVPKSEKFIYLCLENGSDDYVYVVICCKLIVKPFDPDIFPSSAV